MRGSLRLLKPCAPTRSLASARLSRRMQTLPDPTVDATIALFVFVFLAARVAIVILVFFFAQHELCTRPLDIALEVDVD